VLLHGPDAARVLVLLHMLVLVLVRAGGGGCTAGW
jgi:hypothetical protein